MPAAVALCQALVRFTHSYLCPQPPFYSSNVIIMYELIASAELSVPSHLSREAADVLLQLMNRDHTKRLGASEQDVDDVLAHPFFAPLDLDKLRRREATPPFVPPVPEDDEDTRNFDDTFTKEPAIDSVVPESVLQTVAASQAANFEGFSFAPESGLAAAARAAAADHAARALAGGTFDTAAPASDV